jgi:hypothetical protein
VGTRAVALYEVSLWVFAAWHSSEFKGKNQELKSYVKIGIFWDQPDGGSSKHL